MTAEAATNETHHLDVPVTHMAYGAKRRSGQAEAILMTEEVKRQFPGYSLLLGEIRVDRVDVVTMPQTELAHLIAARMFALIEFAADQLRAPTLPVHDEPMPRALRPHTPHT